MRQRLAVCTILAALICGGIALSGCSGGATIPECEDGRDNDHDGFIDEVDPACIAGLGTESDDPTPRCADSLDNDGDGLVDSADPGCAGATDNDEYDVGSPACHNGIDDDDDGKMDFPADPGCANPNQDSENDDCPSGPNCPACGDNVDNDGDGATDYPGDGGCPSASDDDEFVFDSLACGSTNTVMPLVVPGTTTGMIGNRTSQLRSPTCGGNGAEVAYVFSVPRAVVFTASTDGTATNVNTVLSVRRMCLETTSELACNDDISATNNRSKLSAELPPGTYFLIVDGRDLASTGNFTLTTQLFAGRGESCDATVTCAPGYQCRIPFGATEATCEPPVCSDGRDDDSDGKTDYPNDPGCVDAADGDEADPCPGPGCPACADGADNDLDGATDYPMDTACQSAAWPLELSCSGETDQLVLVTGPTTTGTTIGANNDLRPTCGSTFTTTAPDRMHVLALSVPVSSLTMSLTNSFDSTISFTDATCGASVACSDPNTLTRTNLTPGTYGIAIDGWSSGSGTYTLTVHGDLVANGSCNDPLVAAGVLTCPTGYSCSGTGAAAVCAPAACNDSLDADLDGFPGYPSDPGCTSPADNDETDDCPSGVMCPVCGNGMDDDTDGTTDFPNDIGCSSASGTTEVACAAETDPLLPVTGPHITGTTTGASNSLRASCGGSSSTAPERVHTLRLQVPVASLRIDTTTTWDSVVSLTNSTCTTTTVCVDEPPDITRTNVAPGSYAISIDGFFSTSNGAYTMDISGELSVGGACNDPLVAAGVLSCPAGYVCGGPAGAETCRIAACNDAIDADTDGFNGYPTDPGCASLADNDEADDCALGGGAVNCPQCSDDADNDGDGQTDYPNDPSCVAAGTPSELSPCTSLDPVTPLSTNIVGATTTGLANDVTLSCGINGRDAIYRLFVTSPLEKLTVDTFGSDTNTAVAIRTTTCNTTDLACGTNNFGTNDATASINTVVPGEYFIVVDDLNVATPTTYNLNVRAVLPRGARCNPTSQVFVCNDTSACGGTVGAETCVAAACNDPDDPDLDGFPGYPTDPGCASPGDNDETDDCPSGPLCPACSNDRDDDLDGLFDYPIDFGCVAASGTTEQSCPVETDALTVVTMPVTAGTTVGAADNFAPSCQSFSLGDRVHILSLPVPVASLSISTAGSAGDTILMFMQPTCGLPPIACNDDTGLTVQSLITQTNVAAGNYAIEVDTYGGDIPDAYTLTVRGTVAAGTACTSPLFTSGVLACATGTTCQAGTCQ